MKKLKINPFLLHSLKENLPYIIMLITLVFSSFFVVPYMVNKYFENDSKIKELEEKIAQSQIKQNILSAIRSGEAQNIDDDVKLLKSLIPDAENYFSIIYSLEQLSQQTSFIINSYTVNLQETSAEKLSLTVTGIGDQQAFLRFLENYNFVSGRLITAEKIQFNKDREGSTSLTLNFYNKKVSSTDDSNINYQKILAELSEIRSKVSVVIQAEDDEINESYPQEPNPF